MPNPISCQPSTRLGRYIIGGGSGVMTAGLAANAPIFSFRWASAAALACVRRIRISAGGITAFTAGRVIFAGILARSFSVSDTGGTSVVPSAGQNLRRTGMASSVLTDARAATTGALVVGTRTLDAVGFSAIIVSTPATAGTIIVPSADLLRPPESAEDYPLVLTANEGFVIQATVPAGGTWAFAVDVEWDEVTAYPEV